MARWLSAGCPRRRRPSSATRPRRYLVDWWTATPSSRTGARSPTHSNRATLFNSLEQTMTNAIVLRGLTKTFGETVAVRDLDLTVPAGALYGVIGPNGAGKTTTIRMILSILLPDRGELTRARPAVGARGQGPDRLPAGGARPLQEDARRRTSSPTWPGSRATMGRTSDARVTGWLERVGLGGDREQALRGAVEGHAAEGAVPRRRHPPAGPDHPRRAVQRPRPGQPAAAARPGAAKSTGAAPPCCSRRTS